MNDTVLAFELQYVITRCSRKPSTHFRIAIIAIAFPPSVAVPEEFIDRFSLPENNGSTLRSTIPLFIQRHPWRIDQILEKKGFFNKVFNEAYTSYNLCYNKLVT
ncbi:unnamed protein product [Cuscuta europaea]|uniref:Uncharacterized protein n=1 Tax=Cuscuta europaea TaxID=41803 RepID=A0A9P0ZUE1_CUSEU|nr:unnamed protein product [Cuscuta europaea]